MPDIRSLDPSARLDPVAWRAHFAWNAGRPRPIPWGRGVELSERERRAIARSVQAFQRGESSEGRRLLAAAKRWAAAHRDPYYVDTIRLFIREEQRHAHDRRPSCAIAPGWI